jgi:hypothetical protein
MKLLFNKKSKEEEFQEAEERFLNIISSKEYGDMISKQMSEVRQRAKKRNFKFNLIKNINNLEIFVRSLPGTHFRENNYNWITIREDVLVQIMEKIVKGEDISFI